MLDRHIANAPASRYIATESILVKRLDEEIYGRLDLAAHILLKIDTQGFEHFVLQGASGILKSVALIECEVSLVPLYDGQYIWDALLALLKGYGFTPVDFERGFYEPSTGYCLQVDVIFARSSTSRTLSS